MNEKGKKNSQEVKDERESRRGGKKGPFILKTKTRICTQYSNSIMLFLYSLIIVIFYGRKVLRFFFITFVSVYVNSFETSLAIETYSGKLSHLFFFLPSSNISNCSEKKNLRLMTIKKNPRKMKNKK